MGLDPALCPFSRDAAWFGLTRWRELVAQFFDPACAVDALDRIDSVQIEAIAPEPDRTPRIAVWLAAWLAGQLGWKPQGRPVRSSAPSENALDAELVGPRGIIRSGSRPGRHARPLARAPRDGRDHHGQGARRTSSRDVPARSPRSRLSGRPRRCRDDRPVPPPTTRRGARARRGAPHRRRARILAHRSAVPQGAAHRPLAAG